MKYNEIHYKKVHKTKAYNNKIYRKLQKDQTRDKILKGELMSKDFDNQGIYEFLLLLK